MNFTGITKLALTASASGYGSHLNESSSFAERATFGLEVVAIGMAVVFGVLLLLIGILQIFKLFGAKPVNKVKSEEPKAAPAANAPVSTAVAAPSSEEEKIVAIATAAIAASCGKSDVDFQVLSIAPINGCATAQSATPAPAAAPVAPKASEPAPAPAPAPATVVAGDGEKVNAPLPGNILDVKVSSGASVKKGDILCILEAMKMENEIVAPVDGTIVTAAATKGSSVNTGDLLFVIG